MSKLKIYKASAGSGKTYSLTEEYLKLAAIYPDNFMRILAVTFTNKAAEEMKQRILEALNEIITKKEKATFFYLFQQLNSKKSEYEILQIVKTIRDSVLHNYSYFSLSTIDSFVQRVIKAFTYEIGVESSYRIELDADKVIYEITDMLYKQIDVDKELKNWLISFANYKMDDGKSWDFRKEISQLAVELFKEKFDSYDNEKNANAEYEDIKQKFQIVNNIKLEFEKNVKNISTKAINIFKKEEFNANLGRNIGYLKNYFTKKIVEKSKIEDLLPNKTIRGMADDKDAWTAKTASANVKNIADNLYNQLNPLLNEMLLLLQNEFKYYLAAVNVLSIFHAYGILRKLASLLPEYRNNNNVLMISDTTRLLKEIVAGNDAPFIYEKIGNRYKHILIDEFQDTSGFQWANFKPLITNNLAEHNSNLIVGDIKQSIYRWRGGDWNLLLSEVDKDIGKLYIEHKTLETNWRSKKNIIDFNNTFFKIAADFLQNLFNNDLKNSINNLIDENFKLQYEKIIVKAYSDVFQKLPDSGNKQGGRVKIQFYPKGKSSAEWKDEVFERLPDVVEQLLTEQKYKPSDLAILVRKNSEGQEIANCLLSYQNANANAVKYPIISSESLMLINSDAIQILINAMFYIFNPDDNVRLYALVTVYNKAFYPDKVVEHSFYQDIETIKEHGLLPLKFLENINNLRKLNIFELTEELSNIFNIPKLSGQLIYLQSFQDLLLDYLNNNNSDINSFIKWWDEKGKNSSIQLSDEQNALKIMSIHKSKGLAFKIVLVPFCDWSLRPSSNKDLIIWTESAHDGFNQLGNFPIVFRKYLADSIFYKEYYEELLYSFIDAINMLYVVFTRARDELLIMSPYSDGKSETISSVSNLLYNAVKGRLKFDNHINLNDFYDENTKVFELNDLYAENINNQASEKTEYTSNYDVDDYILSNWKSKIKIQRNADDFFAKSIEYIQEKIDYGIFMHKIMSKIKTANDIDAVVNSMYYDGKLNTTEKDLLKDKINEIINRDEVKDWFSDKYEVITEDAILDNRGNTRIPDRVLIGKNETIVIDYKFGKQYDKSITQVEEYMGLLEKMNYKNVKGYVYYVEKNIVEKI